MFKIINRRNFWKRFFRSLLFNIPLFVLIRYFTAPEKLATASGILLVLLMPISISLATAYSQTKTSMLNENENEGLEYVPKPLSHYIGLFFFSVLFIVVVFGLFLLVAVPIFMFVSDEPFFSPGWERYLLLIPFLALYVTLSDWIGNRLIRRKKAY